MFPETRIRKQQEKKIWSDFFIKEQYTTLSLVLI